MKTRRRVAAGLVLALLGAGLVSGIPAVAAGGHDIASDKATSLSAGGPAVISRDVYLTNEAVTGTALLPAGASPRVIYLAAGNYRFTTYLSDSAPAEEWDTYFVLKQGGTYNWRCYIDGTGDAWPKVNYHGKCLLRPHNSDRPDLWLPGGGGAVQWTRYKGTFYWESKLWKEG
ncbi:hypothetical protein [Kribbella italica]|uniref:Uncharacterized protein n=1 Tax=Kribbella italica TaxID=1540520 RepID=A0A7W9JEC2_9ACTN|nr:hypothetical protein [Kribbella italica]MBB5840207.1 hypothetical protein [Kribbella italica]